MSKSCNQVIPYYHFVNVKYNEITVNYNEVLAKQYGRSSIVFILRQYYESHLVIKLSYRCKTKNGLPTSIPTCPPSYESYPSPQRWILYIGFEAWFVHTFFLFNLFVAIDLDATRSGLWGERGRSFQPILPIVSLTFVHFPEVKKAESQNRTAGCPILRKVAN